MNIHHKTIVYQYLRTQEALEPDTLVKKLNSHLEYLKEKLNWV